MRRKKYIDINAAKEVRKSKEVLEARLNESNYMKLVPGVTMITGCCKLKANQQFCKLILLFQISIIPVPLSPARYVEGKLCHRVLSHHFINFHLSIQLQSSSCSYPDTPARP